MYAVFFQLQFFLMVLPFGKDLKSYQELQITSFQLSLMKNQCLKTFFYKSKLFFVQPNFKNYFTQNLPITYKDAGQFYWGSKNWLNKKNIFSNKSKIIL